MPQLSIVVPTFNESGNVRQLVRLVHDALAGIDWELIFVDDDSPDGTADSLRELAQLDPRVRCILRLGRRGLSSACIEGMLASSAPLVAVMDADLQHDERLLRRMLETMRDPDIDVVVGSRYAGDGSVGEWSERRASLSRMATRMSRALLKAELLDPMSGFFMIRREALHGCLRAGVSGVGFKILLDLFATSPQPLRFRELPYRLPQSRGGAEQARHQRGLGILHHAARPFSRPDGTDTLHRLLAGRCARAGRAPGGAGRAVTRAARRPSCRRRRWPRMSP